MENTRIYEIYACNIVDSLTFGILHLIKNDFDILPLR